ncbi:M1 family metallopeptidase [soil metagenome]
MISSLTSVRLVLAAALGLAALPGLTATLPGRLVQPSAPRNYELTIEPSADFASFKGRVVIDLQVDAPTRTVVLNSSRLVIDAATLDDQAATSALDAPNETLTITTAVPIEPGAHKLALDYHGEISEEIDGLYRVDYEDSSGKTRMLATQLEPTGARRLLPCFDEPRFRATFNVTALVPSRFVAVSNGEVVSREKVDATNDRVKFAPSLPMASYLVALFVGPFEHVESTRNGITVRVFTMPGKAEQAREALASSQAVLEFYGEYFGIPYAQAKLDQVAVPGGFNGAMENWGAIAYNEATLLFDARVDSPARRADIWSITAHEIAHQWFGDLVTMRWWDDLWLNEGFATWMANKAVASLHPEWHHELADMADQTRALDDDSLGVVGAIRRPVVDDREATGSIDSITYNKGMALISMVEATVGEAAFRDGMRRYFQQHKFGNTTTDDLWLAFDGIGDVPVPKLADKWVREPGLPLIDLVRRCDKGVGSVTLSQSPFGFIKPVATSADAWFVPVRLAIGARLDDRKTVVVRGEPVSVPLPSCNAPVLVNDGNHGHYRVHYDAASLPLMLKALAARPDAPGDRLGVFSNTVALYWAGAGSLDDVGAVLRAFEREPDALYWKSVVTSLLDLKLANAQTKPGAGWQRTRQQWIATLKAADIAIASVPGGPAANVDRLERREQIYRALGRLGDQPTVVDARIRYATDGGNQDGPAMAHAVLDVVAQHARPFEFDALVDRWRKSNVERERRWLYEAISTVDDPQLAARALALALDASLPSFETMHIPQRLAQAGHERLAWTFVDNHWEQLSGRAGKWLQTEMIAETGRRSTDAARADQIEPTIVRKVGAFAAAPGRRAAQWSRVLVQSQRNAQLSAPKP